MARGSRQGKTKAGSGKQMGRDKSNPSSAVVVYRGPIHTSKPLASDTATVRLAVNFNVTGSSVGYSGYAGTGGVTGSADWSRFAGIYDECRIMGMEMQYVPNAINCTQVVQSAGFTNVTNNPTNPGPFTSLSQVIGYEDWRASNSGQPFRRVWRMSSTEEAQFVSTSSTPASQGWINIWFPNATTTGSAAYGFIIVTYVVQFRGRI
jgi:hypothetical protein